MVQSLYLVGRRVFVPSSDVESSFSFPNLTSTINPTLFLFCLLNLFCFNSFFTLIFKLQINYFSCLSTLLFILLFFFAFFHKHPILHTSRAFYSALPAYRLCYNTLIIGQWAVRKRSPQERKILGPSAGFEPRISEWATSSQITELISSLIYKK